MTEPAWVPEAGTWYVGRGSDGSPVLIRIATVDDRVAVEAQRDTLQQIRDPRVPAVLAHDEGSSSIALSYAVGTPLCEAIDQRTEEGGGGVVLTPATLVDILLEIGRALQAAHAVGVVHGSLDPYRVLFGPEGKIWLFGFGSGVEPSASWLPPEIARGERPTVFTDQWSLAALGLGLVLGHAVWPWQDPGSIGTPGGAIADGDCSALVDTVHRQWPALGRVLGKALSPAPMDRYPTMMDFAVALHQLAELAGGPSERAALGAMMWERRTPQAVAADPTPAGATEVASELPVPDRPTAVPLEREVEPLEPVRPEPPPPTFHQASTVAADTPPPAPSAAEEPPAPAAITRIAPVLVVIAVVMLVAALGYQLLLS